MAPTIREVVEWFLEDRRDFSVAEVAARSGASRQAVLRVLRPLLLDRRLQVLGTGRATRYLVIPRAEHDPLDGESLSPFWEKLMNAAPALHYVRIARVVEGTPATRAQARALSIGWQRYQLVALDFHGVEQVGVPFVNELTAQERRLEFSLELFHASSPIQHLFARARWWCRVKPVSDWCC